MKIPKIITAEFLRSNPNMIFVFGDNTIRKGKGGAAILRDEPNTYGFITKKYPNNRDCSFYKLDEYYSIFLDEIDKMESLVRENPNKTFLISKLGAGLANKYRIYEKVIKWQLVWLEDTYKNVVLLD